MKDSFPYPVPRDAVEMFCHPADASGLSRAMRYDREILAANGYVAIRVERGGWLDREFPAASAEFLGRIGKLPWAAFPRECKKWQSLDMLAGKMGLRGGIGLWLNGRLAPTPIWLVGAVKVRLSILQLVARLPRAEVNWTDSRTSPLWFRFSGGMGAIAADPALWEPGKGVAFRVWEDQADPLGGGLMARRTGQGTVRLSQPGVNWPPAEAES